MNGASETFGRSAAPAIIVGLVIALTLTTTASAHYLSVRVQVIDRGQADGILIRTPNEKWVVIDAGTNAEQADGMVDSWGVDTVALAVVTHRHYDHLGGMDSVLENIPVKLFIGDMENTETTVADDSMRVWITRNSIPVQAPGADTISIDSVQFTILPQPPRVDYSDENNNSIMVRLDFGEFSMLFTGDAEEEELEWMINECPDLLDVDVLKASHHGSNNGTSEEWLEAVTPERVVIPVGVSATYGHPHEDAVHDYLEAADGDVYCTNRHSSIRVYGYQDGSIRITTLLDSDKSCVYDGTHY